MLPMTGRLAGQSRDEAAAIARVTLAGRLGVVGSLLSCSALPLVLLDITPRAGLAAIVAGVALGAVGLTLAWAQVRACGRRVASHPGPPVTGADLRRPLAGTLYGLMALALALALGPPTSPTAAERTAEPADAADPGPPALAPADSPDEAPRPLGLSPFEIVD